MSDQSAPPGRNFSSWASWSLQLGAVERPPRCPTGPTDAVDAWRRTTRATLDELLGPWPEPPPGGARLQTLNTIEHPHYSRHEIVFDVEATMSVPATLLVPHERVEPGPAVLAIHGHGPGRTELCDPTPDAAGAFAHDLAVVGFVVLAPDLRGFGQRAEPLDAFGREWCDANLVWATMAGISPLTQNLWDLALSLDVLVDHPLVDPARLGVAGFSYGATCSLFLAALDNRVRAAAVSGYLCTWAAAHRVPLNMCGSQVLPGQLGRIEHGDLAALILPRALWIESGRHDVVFPADVATAEVEHVRRVAASTGGAVEHHVHDGEHEWRGRGLERFFTHTL